jgi:fucose permease
MTPIEALVERARPHRGAFIVLHAGFVLTGIVTTLLGPILPTLATRWFLSDSGAGLFFTLQFCGNLAGIASLGALLSWRGYRLTFFLGFAFVSLGIAFLLPVGKLSGMV